MKTSSALAYLAGLTVSAGTLATPAMSQAMGADAAACSEPAAAAVRVHITGFKSGEGTVRVQAYGANPADFLATGKWVRRVEVPLQGRRSLDLCLRLPGYGDYALAVRHDANGDRKSDWNDGGGFSRNPRLSLFHLKPAYADVAVRVSRDMPAVAIVMNYRQGLSIRPLNDAAVP